MSTYASLGKDLNPPSVGGFDDEPSFWRGILCSVNRHHDFLRVTVRNAMGLSSRNTTRVVVKPRV